MKPTIKSKKLLSQVIGNDGETWEEIFGRMLAAIEFQKHKDPSNLEVKFMIQGLDNDPTPDELRLNISRVEYESQDEYETRVKTHKEHARNRYRNFLLREIEADRSFINSLKKSLANDVLTTSQTYMKYQHIAEAEQNIARNEELLRKATADAS